jgi:hypothetical protein
LLCILTQAFLAASPVTPPRLKFSRLSPTTEGVFEPTWIKTVNHKLHI